MTFDPASPTSCFSEKDYILYLAPIETGTCKVTTRYKDYNEVEKQVDSLINVISGCNKAVLTQSEPSKKVIKDMKIEITGTAH